MYPPLLSLFPSFAESINNYRSRDLGAARANAAQYNRSGLLYPWVSFRYANCTGIGPCYDYEYHLNNDIALAQWQYYQATRNQTWLERKGWPILKAVSEFWASQVVRDEGSGRYSANNVTSPDEYSNFRNNSAFVSTCSSSPGSAYNPARTHRNLEPILHGSQPHASQLFFCNCVP